MWLSLVERFVRDEEVACSNHVIPTKAQILRSELFVFIFLALVSLVIISPFSYTL